VSRPCGAFKGLLESCLCGLKKRRSRQNQSLRIQANFTAHNKAHPAQSQPIQKLKDCKKKWRSLGNRWRWKKKHGGVTTVWGRSTHRKVATKGGRNLKQQTTQSRRLPVRNKRGQLREKAHREPGRQLGIKPKPTKSSKKRKTEHAVHPGAPKKNGSNPYS